jgi:hypothetical protein
MRWRAGAQESPFRESVERGRRRDIVNPPPDRLGALFWTQYRCIDLEIVDARHMDLSLPPTHRRPNRLLFASLKDHLEGTADADELNGQASDVPRAIGENLCVVPDVYGDIQACERRPGAPTSAARPEDRRQQLADDRDGAA